MNLENNVYVVAWIMKQAGYFTVHYPYNLKAHKWKILFSCHAHIMLEIKWTKGSNIIWDSLFSFGWLLESPIAVVLVITVNFMYHRSAFVFFRNSDSFHPDAFQILPSNAPSLLYIFVSTDETIRTTSPMFVQHLGSVWFSSDFTIFNLVLPNHQIRSLTSYTCTSPN